MILFVIRDHIAVSTSLEKLQEIILKDMTGIWEALQKVIIFNLNFFLQLELLFLNLKKILIFFQDAVGEKPLHKAARSGKTEVLKHVTSGTVTLNTTIPTTMINVLHLSCIEGLLEMSAYLINNGLSVNSLDCEGNFNLRFFVQLENLWILNILLQL